jgi:copper chaperone
MIDLKVSGMTCGGCVRAVEKAIARLDPSAKATVNLENGQVRIESDKPANAFAEAIEAAGYEIAA